MEETRVILRNVGKINPTSIEDFKAHDGFKALEKALSMSPQEVIDIISASGLRGRGGAGFPVGLKWNMVLGNEADQKYIVCNADEGEPATNKDRVLMNGDPLSLVESLVIGGYSVGATKGFIYLRAEYPYIFPVLREAINNAKEAGYLGKNILGSGFDFELDLVSGGGAYVCGEETALIESIEGKRGESRFKPPYPGVSGLYDKPTVINNVETLVNVPVIILNGYKWYREIGTEDSPGTKLFTLCGNLNRRGIFEFPMGVSLRDLIYEVGEGVCGGDLLAVQLGGGSGPIINASQIDINLEIDKVGPNGISLGAGGVMAINDSHDIVDIVENTLEFFADESCGKCTPCREGTIQLLRLMRKIKSGEAHMRDLENLEELADVMVDTALCGLGQTSSVPLLSSLKNFNGEFVSILKGGDGLW
ncbi:MAG: NADH-ubiquinone oxidoreductase-F iron-sulfur binding region domain-containing protein [Bacillota bacterium]|nr:NADH-ubiquinone oxidoreductase-F iron-sulfur binding region domain-containing protein [Bacillota bacterium]